MVIEFNPNCLSEGLPPDNEDILRKITIREDVWYTFMCEKYLSGFIKSGGSKVKLVVGSEGSGKTHHLYLLKNYALKQDYLVAYISARLTKLQYFNDLYAAIIRSIEMQNLIRRYSQKIVRDLGYNPDEITEDMDFFKWATTVKNKVPELLKRRVMEEMEKLFRNRRIEPTFAIAIMQLSKHHLGVKPLEENDLASLLDWISAAKINLIELRKLHIFSRIDRYNARNMLRSVLEISRLAGFCGLLVCIDDTDVLTERHHDTGKLIYTRTARDDAYESIRQLIDDIDNLERVIFVIAARRQLLEDEKMGVKSYDALWLRLQKEIFSDKFNKFADTIDLDEARRVFFTKEDYISLVNKVMDLCKEQGISASGLDQDSIKTITSLEEAVSPIRRLVISAISGHVPNREV